MSPTRSSVIVGLISTLIISFSAPVHALGVTAWFLIDVYQTEIGGSGFRIVPDGTVENPDGCPSASAYVSPASTAGSDQRLSLVLAAANAGREVQVILNGCENDQPKIVAIVAR